MEGEGGNPLWIEVAGVSPWTHGCQADLSRGEVEVTAAAVGSGEMSAAMSQHSLDILRVEDRVVIGDVHPDLEGGVAVSGGQEVAGHGGQLHTANGAAHAEARQCGGKDQQTGLTAHIAGLGGRSRDVWVGGAEMMVV